MPLSTNLFLTDILIALSITLSIFPHYRVFRVPLFHMLTSLRARILFLSLPQFRSASPFMIIHLNAKNIVIAVNFKYKSNVYVFEARLLIKLICFFLTTPLRVKPHAKKKIFTEIFHIFYK
jgi:hypothetical protein